VSECFRGGEIFVEVLLGTGGSHSREVWIDPAVEQRKGGEPDHQEGEQDPSPSAAEKSNASRPPSVFFLRTMPGDPCNPLWTLWNDRGVAWP